jgi:malate synthase
MKDAIHQRISYTAPNGKQYNIRKDGKIATLIVR